MSTFQINVSKDGKHLFRTEEQSIGAESCDQEQVSLEIASKFPPSEGYEVMLIIWPSKSGRMVNLSEEMY